MRVLALIAVLVLASCHAGQVPTTEDGAPRAWDMGNGTTCYTWTWSSGSAISCVR